MSDNVKVMCKFRPLNKTELLKNQDPVAEFIDSNRLKLKKVEPPNPGPLRRAL